MNIQLPITGNSVPAEDPMLSNRPIIFFDFCCFRCVTHYVAVNICINCSFLHLYLLFYYRHWIISCSAAPLESTSVFAYLLYNFHGATMNIKGSLLMSVPIISGFGGKFGWVTGPINTRSPRTPYLDSRPRFAYSLYNFHGATMNIKGSLLMSVPIISGFGEKIWLGHVTCK